jgi:anti-sigma B factor antagonist
MNYRRVDEPEGTILYIRGELDALSAADLRPLLDKLVEDRPQRVLVDLSELRLVDSSGIGALVSLYKRVRAQGGSVTFTGVTAQPLVIFKLLRLDVVFELELEQAAAVPESAPETPPPSIRVVRS